MTLLLFFQARSGGLPPVLAFLLTPYCLTPYCAGHLSVQLNGCDGAPFGPGFVIITFPGRPPQIFFTSLSFVGFCVPGATSTTLIQEINHDGSPSDTGPSGVISL